jgi:hypothetical protein
MAAHTPNGTIESEHPLVAVRSRDHPAFGPFDVLGGVREVLVGLCDVVERFGVIRLALFERLDSRDVVDHLAHGFRDPVQHIRPLERGPMPDFVLRFSGGSHRTLDVGGRRQGHIGDVVAGCRADEFVDAVTGALSTHRRCRPSDPRPPFLP